MQYRRLLWRAQYSGMADADDDVGGGATALLADDDAAFSLLENLYEQLINQTRVDCWRLVDLRSVQIEFFQRCRLEKDKMTSHTLVASFWNKKTTQHILIRRIIVLHAASCLARLSTRI